MARLLLPFALVPGLVAQLSQAHAEVAWWQTARDTTDRLSEKPPLSDTEGQDVPVTSGPRIAVDSSRTFGNGIMGFGGAFSQASATVWQQLPTNLRGELLQKYFDGDQGLGYTTGRLPIHSCDFATETYTFDDVAGDFSLSHFDTSVAYDANLSIPMVASALSLNPNLKLFGSPWSPPAWMKSNGEMKHGGKLLPEAAGAWALYFKKWLTAYEARGVPVWGVTVQNEPDATQIWESCVFTPEEMAAFVQDHLGPLLRSSFPDLKILGFDHNKNRLLTWAETLLGGSAAAYFDGIAYHWYGGSCFNEVAQVSNRYPEALLLPSEACYELTRFTTEDADAGEAWLVNGTWWRGEGYGFDILGDLRSGSNGWTDWNLILDHSGGPNHVGNLCDAPVVADLREGGTKTLHFHPQFFYLGHFSKFILPKSLRLAATVTRSDGTVIPEADDGCSGWPAYGKCPADAGLQTTAFRRPDGQVAVVVLNCADKDLEDVTISVDAQKVVNTVPAHSIQTYIFPGCEDPAEL